MEVLLKLQYFMVFSFLSGCLTRTGPYNYKYNPLLQHLNRPAHGKASKNVRILLLFTFPTLGCLSALQETASAITGAQWPCARLLVTKLVKVVTTYLGQIPPPYRLQKETPFCTALFLGIRESNPALRPSRMPASCSKLYHPAALSTRFCLLFR